MYNKNYTPKTDDERKALTTRLQTKLDTLANELIFDTDKLKMFAKQWSNGFHNYSMCNTLMIVYQRPGATLCASFKTWSDKGRNVNKGEKGLEIFVPMFTRDEVNENGEKENGHLIGWKIGHTFDYSQTNGKDIEIGHSELIKGNAEVTLDELSKIFVDYPLFFDAGIRHEGGYCNVKKEIHLTPHHKEIARIAVYLHELAHIELGHVTEEWSDEHRTPRDVRELEAEAVSHIVCDIIGIQNEQSPLYIGNWQGDKAKMENSGKRILATAERITRKIMDKK
jgi:hypothetical protein